MTRTSDRLRTLLIAAVGALLLVGVPSTPARGATHEVRIVDFAFAPATLTIAAGDTVVWTNDDPIIHTATSVNGAFDSGDLDQGDSYSLTFTTPGTYDYLCTPHPSMTGRIVVVAAAAPSAAPSGEVPNVAVPAGDDASLRLLGAGLLALGALALVLTRRPRLAVRRPPRG